MKRVSLRQSSSGILGLQPEMRLESSFDFLLSACPRQEKYKNQNIYCAHEKLMEQDFFPQVPEVLIEDFVTNMVVTRKDQNLLKSSEYLPNLSLLEQNSNFFIAG